MTGDRAATLTGLAGGHGNVARARGLETLDRGGHFH